MINNNSDVPRGALRLSAMRVVKETHWKDIPLKYEELKYPQPDNPALPRNFFRALFVGAPGSGKTYSCVQLIKQYEKCGVFDPDTHEKVDQKVILFSPTHDSNPVFNALKYLDEEDIITDFTDGKFLAKIEAIKYEREHTLIYQKN